MDTQQQNGIMRIHKRAKRKEWFSFFLSFALDSLLLLPVLMILSFEEHNLSHSYKERTAIDKHMHAQRRYSYSYLLWWEQSNTFCKYNSGARTHIHTSKMPIQRRTLTLFNTIDTFGGCLLHFRSHYARARNDGVFGTVTQTGSAENNEAHLDFVFYLSHTHAHAEPVRIVTTASNAQHRRSKFMTTYLSFFSYRQ